MGQYYYIVNVTKKQYLHPHEFNTGLKLREIAYDSFGVLTGLALLLADGNGRGGGDFDSTSKLIGSWAGDKIVITGDYADDTYLTKAQKKKYQNLCDLATNKYKNISKNVLALMLEDQYLRNKLCKEIKEGEAQGYGGFYPFVQNVKDLCHQEFNF